MSMALERVKAANRVLQEKIDELEKEIKKRHVPLYVYEEELRMIRDNLWQWVMECADTDRERDLSDYREYMKAEKEYRMGINISDEG